MRESCYSDHAVVEANQEGSGTEFIPVAESKEEQNAAKRSYDRVLLADQAEINRYLKAILPERLKPCRNLAVIKW
ncbi:MAG: hypothetical protein HKN57_01650 [Xanthomonadales bacterium]|nr:hypothetical protein [Xanthomonadales bacterium]